MRHISGLFLLLTYMLADVALMGGARPNVGIKAPDFSLPSLVGETIRLSEITGRGPVVLIVLRGYGGTPHGRLPILQPS